MQRHHPLAYLARRKLPASASQACYRELDVAVLGGGERLHPLDEVLTSGLNGPAALMPFKCKTASTKAWYQHEKSYLFLGIHVQTLRSDHQPHRPFFDGTAQSLLLSNPKDWHAHEKFPLPTKNAKENAQMRKKAGAVQLPKKVKRGRGCSLWPGTNRHKFKPEYRHYPDSSIAIKRGPLKLTIPCN